MVGDVEALGGLATAGLAAAALENRRGAAGEAHGVCPNCATPIAGRFCHECGQPAHTHRSVGHLVEEFTHGIWHFDTKAWRTLPMLAFQPGKLTRDYIDGKRARYVAPLALFLFTIFLMFFVFGILFEGVLPAETEPVASKASRIAAAEATLAESRESLKDAKAKLADVEADPKAAPGQEGEFSGQVAMHEAAVMVAEKSLAKAKAAPDKAVLSAGRKTDPGRGWQERLRSTADTTDVDTGNAELDAKVRHALRNPELALYKIQQKAYKLSFLLVPMSLPFLWLLFPFRRGINMYDHTVFALYSLSFMSLLFVLWATLAQGPEWLAGSAGILALAVPLHMFAQLKGAYSLTTGGALWRTFWLLVFSFISLTIFAVGIVLVGVLD